MVDGVGKAWRKTERRSVLAFCKALMHNVRFLAPPPFSFGFVQFWLRNLEPRMDTNQHELPAGIPSPVGNGTVPFFAS
jgi:hypothetical protein